MAIITIDNIQTMQHLNYMFEYIQDLKKTDNGCLVSCFMCNEYTINYDFEFERKQQIIKKGPNLAWHIIQSFSPDDNVTPEQAHQIGREFMERKFPGYQYIIATHIDKDHIHNHIVLNSVNYITHKKLHTNTKNYYEMREVSDEICLKNGLSVIEKKSRSKTIQLKAAIDEAIKNSQDLNEFIAEMQNKGYVIKRGNKYFSFKNKEMKRFIRSTSISLDYSEQAIKTRIEANNVGKKIREPKKHRQIQDDKVKYTSQRKILKVEIDSSIEKCNSWEEFIADMQRKKFVVKDKCKYLAMQLPDGKKNIRTMSLGLEYDEEFIRYRLENKEEFKRLSAVNIIPKMYDKRGSRVDAGLAEWMSGENSHIAGKMFGFLHKQGLFMNEKSNRAVDFYYFMQNYNSEYAKIENLENDIEAINEKIRALIEVKNSIKTFWKYKSTVNINYEMLNNNELNDIEKSEYIDIVNEFVKAKEILENAKVKFNLDKDVYSFNAVQNVVDELLNEKRALTKEKLEAKYSFQTWDNVKYNLEMVYGVSEEKSENYIQSCKEQEQQKQERKNKIKGFLGL